MARKSKADAAADGKVIKVKTGVKSASAKTRKAATPKKRTAEKVKPEVTTAVRKPLNPTDEQIQMRAYFISERRRRFDLPGDANSDWLEAKRQLLTETRH